MSGLTRACLSMNQETESEITYLMEGKKSSVRWNRESSSVAFLSFHSLLTRAFCIGEKGMGIDEMPRIGWDRIVSYVFACC